MSVYEPQRVSLSNEAIAPLPLNERKRHETLWLEEGNVILATSTVLFRVVRSSLTRHSPFFRDLFLLPQPLAGSPGESLDGLPVVQLYDEPDPLAHFLWALHDPFYYCNTKRTKFDVVAALLRLSTKYQVEELRIRAATHLTSIYPDDFDDFENYLDRHYDLNQRDAHLVYDEDDLQAVRLAREAGLYRILPVAFYWMTDAYYNGCSYEGISKSDRNTIRHGSQKLCPELTHKIGKFLPEPSPQECSESFFCDLAKYAHLESQEWKMWLMNPHIFQPGIRNVMDTDLIENLCSTCTEMLESSMDEGRRKVWEELPRYFNLPDWKTLKESSSC